MFETHSQSRRTIYLIVRGEAAGHRLNSDVIMFMLHTCECLYRTIKISVLPSETSGVSRILPKAELNIHMINCAYIHCGLAETPPNHSMTAPPPVLSSSSILPPPSHCAFLPAKQNSTRVSKPLLFNFFTFFKIELISKLRTSGSVWEL
jgi:hypothetical protein